MKTINKEVFKKSLCMYLIIMLGTAISTFGISNIHTRTGITEGGVIGAVLLANHWFHIPTYFLTLFLDGICYVLGYKILGKRFLKLSIFATCSVSFFYFLYSLFPPMLPDLSGHPLIAAILGGCFVGVGVSLIVMFGAASGGDDALALVISNTTKLPLARTYLFTDLVVLLLSLSYIPFRRIIFSLVTVTISSFIIGFFENYSKKENSMLQKYLSQLE